MFHLTDRFLHVLVLVFVEQIAQLDLSPRCSEPRLLCDTVTERDCQRQ